MKPTFRYNSSDYILLSLSMQHCALKKIKTDFGLNQRELEVLSACFADLQAKNNYFTLPGVRAAMKDAYTVCATRASIERLIKKKYIALLLWKVNYWT